MTSGTVEKNTEVRILEKHDNAVTVALSEGKYKLELLLDVPVETEIGKRAKGMILAQIWKVDLVSKGGAYVEPVWGSPRRIQGRVVGIDPDENSLLIYVSGGLVNCVLRQDLYNAEDYQINQNLAVDPYDGVKFIPA